MKTILFSTVLGLSVLFLNGCTEGKKPQEPAMKCEAGKCGQGKCGDQ